MAWDEQDIQRVLTDAVNRYVELLSERAPEPLRYECITRSSGNQSPFDPNSVGIDVLSILAADRLLAIELKKCKFDDQGQRPKIGVFKDGQLELLERLTKQPSVSAYVVFNTLPKFEFPELPRGPQRTALELSSMAALPPRIFNQSPEILNGYFAGKGAVGATALDAFTKALVQRPLNKGTPFAQWLEVFQMSVGSINNCILWFISDGYVHELTFDQLQIALPHLQQLLLLPKGKSLIEAHRLLQYLRRHKSTDVTAIAEAEQIFKKAQQECLAAIRQHAIDLAVAQQFAIPHDVNEEPEDEPEPPMLGYDGP